MKRFIPTKSPWQVYAIGGLLICGSPFARIDVTGAEYADVVSIVLSILLKLIVFATGYGVLLKDTGAAKGAIVIYGIIFAFSAWAFLWMILDVRPEAGIAVLVLALGMQVVVCVMAIEYLWSRRDDVFCKRVV